MGDASRFLPTEPSAQGHRRPLRGDEKKEAKMTGPEQMVGFEQTPHVCRGPWIWNPAPASVPFGAGSVWAASFPWDPGCPDSPRWPYNLAGFAVRKAPEETEWGQKRGPAAYGSELSASSSWF